MDRRNRQMDETYRRNRQTWEGGGCGFSVGGSSSSFPFVSAAFSLDELRLCLRDRLRSAYLRLRFKVKKLGGVTRITNHLILGMAVGSVGAISRPVRILVLVLLPDLQALERIHY